MTKTVRPEILVLFDIDGTLLHAAGSGRVATERAMREVFGTIGKLADYSFSGKTDWHTLLTLLAPEGFTEAQIEAALPQYNDAIARHMADIMADYHIRALPGTLEIVHTLREHPNVLLGLITGNMPQMADLKLRAAGFAPDDFSIAVYGSEAPIRRQLVPLALQRAEQRWGRQFDPPDVVFIGDTPDDIDCAHSIGARAVAVTTGWVSRAELEAHQPVTVIDSLADQEKVLSIIFAE
jgi:phosphoglycolate phosphatase